MATLKQLEELIVWQKARALLYAASDEVSKMIASFIRYLNTTDIKGQKNKNRSNGNTPN
jgi:hypothetical protein